MDQLTAHSVIVGSFPSFFPDGNSSKHYVDEFVRKVNKWHRYVQKVQRMVRDVESGGTFDAREDAPSSRSHLEKKKEKLPGIAECWRW